MLVITTPLPQCPEAARIALTRGLWALIDEEDYDWLRCYSWRAQQSSSSIYAVTRIQHHNKVYTYRMHRVIMACPHWLKVHHKNHYTLDNRKENLQIVTEREHRHFDGWHIFRR